MLPSKKRLFKDKGFGADRRLHYRWEYVRFFDGAEVFRMGECVVFRISNDLNTPRLGITLKARGSSLERNRTKRVIRESFRSVGSGLGSFDYNVVIPGDKKMGFPYPKRLAARLSQGWRGISNGSLKAVPQKQLRSGV